jgi:hypothetical protein
MADANARFAEVLETASDDAQVEWFGEKRLLSYHLGVIISHEMLHLGQIIAFCYAMDIEIP